MKNTIEKSKKSVCLIALASNKFEVIDLRDNTKTIFDAKYFAQKEFERKCKLYELIK